MALVPLTAAAGLVATQLLGISSRERQQQAAYGYQLTQHKMDQQHEQVMAQINVNHTERMKVIEEQFQVMMQSIGKGGTKRRRKRDRRAEKQNERLMAILERLTGGPNPGPEGKAEKGEGKKKKHSELYESSGSESSDDEE